MDIKIPGLELIGPLRSRPLYGASIGAFVGFCFGVLSRTAHFAAEWSGRIEGFTLGGLVAGLLIGGMLPLLRSRWLAFAVVTFASTCAIAVGFYFLKEALPLPGIVFLGFIQGFVYAALLWDYKPGLSPHERVNTELK